MKELFDIKSNWDVKVCRFWNVHVVEHRQYSSDQQNQLCSTRDPNAAKSKILCGPARFSLLCMYNTMTSCHYFDNLKFGHFRCNGIKCLFIMFYALVDLDVSTDTSVQNWFLVFWVLLMCSSARNWFLITLIVPVALNLPMVS